MPIITHRNPVIVNINGQFNWGNFANGFGEAWSNKDIIFTQKIESRESKPIYICKVSGSRFLELKNDMESSVIPYYYENQCRIFINNLICIDIDTNVNNDNVIWEFHWEGTL